MKNKIINIKDREKLHELPNPRIHQAISFMKSCIRFGACTFLGFGMLPSSAVAFGIAEVLGIIEEIF